MYQRSHPRPNGATLATRARKRGNSVAVHAPRGNFRDLTFAPRAAGRNIAQLAQSEALTQVVTSGCQVVAVSDAGWCFVSRHYQLWATDGNSLTCSDLQGLPPPL